MILSNFYFYHAIKKKNTGKNSAVFFFIRTCVETRIKKCLLSNEVRNYFIKQDKKNQMTHQNVYTHRNQSKITQMQKIGCESQFGDIFSPFKKKNKKNVYFRSLVQCV